MIQKVRFGEMKNKHGKALPRMKNNNRKNCIVAKQILVILVGINSKLVLGKVSVFFINDLYDDNYLKSYFLYIVDYVLRSQG